MAPAQPPDGARGGYWPALDGLRALAVLAVVWHHTRPSDVTSPIGTRGYLGVDVFFVLSGFLITTLLLREERERGRIALGRFWARRALRLFPLWYALLLALTGVFLFVTPDVPMAAPFIDELAFHATYTSDFIIGATLLSISWSLAVEEQFYLVWPALLSRARSLVLPAAVLVTGASIGVHVGAFDHLFERAIGPRWKEYSALTATVLPLVLGCLLATQRARTLRARIAPPGSTALWFAALVGVALWDTEENYVRFAAQLAAAGLVASCLNGHHRILENRALTWVGRRAYGVYLLHMLCREAVFACGVAPDGHRELDVFAWTTLLSIVAAGLSYRWLESPFLRLKDRFR